jgi:hypothetical protein
MKYLPHFLLGIVTALSLGSCAAPGGAADSGGATAQAQLGPHSAEKFEMVRRIGARSLDPNVIETMALVLTVEQTMNGNQQEITARASARRDGPKGAVQTAKGVQVRITSPAPAATSEPHSEPGVVNVTKTLPAPGGKYQSVTAEATMANPEYTNAHVTLTIPGDQ